MPTSMSQNTSAVCSSTRLSEAEENVKDSFPKAATLCQEACSPITKASGTGDGLRPGRCLDHVLGTWEHCFQQEPRLTRSYVTCRYGSSLPEGYTLLKPKGIQMGSQFELNFPWKDVPVKGTILSSQVFTLAAHFLPAVKSKTNQNEPSTCYLYCWLPSW